MLNERVYLDANIFILAMETRGAVSDELMRLLAGELADQLALITSDLTLAELLVGPIKTGNKSLVSTYEGIVNSNATVETAPVSRDILGASAWLRAVVTSLKLPDAIHLATAASMSCTKFLTDDRGIPPRILVPNDALAHSRPGELWFQNLTRLEAVRPDVAVIAKLTGSIGRG